MGAALLSVAKKSFRHAEAFFRASKSSEKWGSSSCRTPFRVSRTHPSAPLMKVSPLGGGLGAMPQGMAPSLWEKPWFFRAFMV